MGSGPNSEFSTKYTETWSQEFTYRKRCGGGKGMQYSFCRSSLIQGKSEWENTSETDSPSKNRDEKMEKHSLFWGLFLTSSLHAAIFLGKDDSENLRCVRDTDPKAIVQKLFDVTQKNWSASKSWRCRECQNYSGELLHGRSFLWYMIRRRLSSWRQKFMYSPTLCCVLEEYANSLNLTKTGKDDSRGSKVRTNRIGWTRWWTRVESRVDDFPRTHYTADSLRDPKLSGNFGLWTETIPRTNNLHVDFWRHRLGNWGQQ